MAQKKGAIYKKLSDFNAHNGKVTCLALGHKSGHVLATGGEDLRVNLWAIGSPSRILSLGGLTYPSSCVRFGHTENHVAAGGVGGEVKIWDLEAADNLLHNLEGHKRTIRSIEFHPYGDFVTTGASDKLIKLWDMRKKGSIFVYRGHLGGVNTLQFSPDGYWIASGADDGAVMLWDLRMGKLLKEFTQHKGPVNSVQFHPHDFLLSSGSEDGVVNFWDLEHFNLVSSTSEEYLPSRCIYFSSAGDMLYSGAPDCLNVYSWEPANKLTQVSIPWGYVDDIAAGETNLIGASHENQNVSIWVINPALLLTQPEPNEKESTPVVSNSFNHASPIRKSFNKQKSNAEARKTLRVKTIEEVERSEDELPPEIPKDYTSVFTPSRALNRSPTISMYANSPPNSLIATSYLPSTPKISKSRVPSPEPATPIENNDILLIQQSPSSTLSPEEEFHIAEDYSPSSNSLVERSMSPEKEELVRRHSTYRQEAMDQEPDFPVKLSSIHHSNSETNIPRPRENSSLQSRKPQKSVSQTSIAKPVLRETKSDRGPTTQTQPDVAKDEFVPMSVNRPTGLDIDDFLPKNASSGMAYSESTPNMSEAEVFNSIMKGNPQIITILEKRARELQIYFNLWQNKDLKTAVEAVIDRRDIPVLVDFLGVITLKPTLWNLDICVALLPELHTLLESKYETHMRAGCDALRLILRSFMPVIRTNVLSGCSGVGVDLSREERYKKCVKCYNLLLSIRTYLLKRQTMQGQLGQYFRELHVTLQGIDS